jgi:hypothetical protein
VFTYLLGVGCKKLFQKKGNNMIRLILFLWLTINQSTILQGMDNLQIVARDSCPLCEKKFNDNNNNPNEDETTHLVHANCLTQLQEQVDNISLDTAAVPSRQSTSSRARQTWNRLIERLKRRNGSTRRNTEITPLIDQNPRIIKKKD